MPASSASQSEAYRAGPFWLSCRRYSVELNGSLRVWNVSRNKATGKIIYNARISIHPSIHSQTHTYGHKDNDDSNRPTVHPRQESRENESESESEKDGKYRRLHIQVNQAKSEGRDGGRRHREGWNHKEGRSSLKTENAGRKWASLTHNS